MVLSSVTVSAVLVLSGCAGFLFGSAERARGGTSSPLQRLCEPLQAARTHFAISCVDPRNYNDRSAGTSATQS